MNIIEQFTEFLATKRRRLTDSSAQVVTAVFSRPGMSSADEIADAVRGKVSRATTYRTLSWLVEANLLAVDDPERDALAGHLVRGGETGLTGADDEDLGADGG